MLSSLGSFRKMSMGFLGFGGLSCRRGGWTELQRVLHCHVHSQSGAQSGMSMTKGCLRLQQLIQQMHLEPGRQIGSDCKVMLQRSKVILWSAPDLQVVEG